MRINEAIKLQRARQKEENKKNGDPLNHNLINKAKLGRMIWPDQKEKRPLTSMWALTSGKMKTIRIVWIYIICRECKVDPNFLLRKPSIHDEDFERLVLSKEKS